MVGTAKFLSRDYPAKSALLVSLSMSPISAEILFEKRIYFPNDIIEGLVKLDFKKDTDIKLITLTYRVVETVRIKSDQSDFSMLKKEVKSLYSDSIKLFPFPHLHELNQFKVKSNEYVHSFEIHIPDIGLPPNFADPLGPGIVEHMLSVCIERTSALKANYIHDEDFEFRPYADPELAPFISSMRQYQFVEKIDLEKSRGLFNRKKTPVTMEIILPKAILSTLLPINLTLNSMKEFKVTKFTVFLQGLQQAVAQGYSGYYELDPIEILRVRDLDLVGKSIDLSSYFEKCHIPSIVPSFDSELIQLEWQIEFVVTVSNPFRESSKKIKSKHGIFVLSDIREDDALYMTPFEDVPTKHVYEQVEHVE